jgi:uncharacterized membrane protein
MIAVAASSLFIHTIRIWDVWSPIHLLSMFTLPTVPLAVVYAAASLWPGRIITR